MKPIEVLKEEHKAIKLMLTVIESICTRLESRVSVPPEHIEKILDFLKQFADKCHHHKEEEILFPEMEKAGIPKEGGPLGVMLQEHQIGRKYIRNMSEAFERYKNDVKETSGIIENGRAYAALLSQHINKEDNILYPMAERALPESVMDSMTGEFEKVEEEIIGKGKHEQYHRLIKELKDIYL